MLPLLLGFVPLLTRPQAAPAVQERVVPASRSMQQPPAPQPPAAQTPSPPAAAPQGAFPWYAKDLDSAFKDAKAQQKLLFVLFDSASSPAAMRMANEVFADSRVVDVLKDAICVHVDVDKHRDLAIKYSVQDPPVSAWFNSDGTPRDRINGFKEANVFVSMTSRIHTDLGTINDLKRKIAAKGDDIDTRFELYRRLKEFGDIAASSEQKAAIIKLDPQGNSRASHHFTYERITGEIEQYWAQTGTLHMHKIEELQTFVEMESDVELVWDGWMRLANTHAYLANQAASKGQFTEAKDHRVTRRKFIARSWRGVPQDVDYFRDWCLMNCELFWNERDELTPEDKEFFTTMTSRMIAVYEKDPLAFDYRARAYLLGGQRPQAIDAEEKAIELDPNNPDFKARLKQLRGD